MKPHARGSVALTYRGVVPRHLARGVADVVVRRIVSVVRALPPNRRECAQVLHQSFEGVLQAGHKVGAVEVPVLPVVVARLQLQVADVPFRHPRHGAHFTDANLVDFGPEGSHDAGDVLELLGVERAIRVVVALLFRGVTYS